MPFGLHPICKKCSTDVSEMWRKNDDGDIECNTCATIGHSVTHDDNSNNNNDNNNNEKESSDKNNGINEVPKTSAVTKRPMVTLRKSARCKAKMRTAVLNKTNTVKGRSRRIIFKRNVYRSPMSFATIVTSNSLFYNGRYYQIGDIVSMIDIDGSEYYAQITGFLQDQYCEKSATVTWLLPSQESPTDRFDPSTYFLGPTEEIPRKLEFMEFVCHAPSDYFKSRSAPYPTIPENRDRGYVWTAMGEPRIVANPFNDH